MSAPLKFQVRSQPAIAAPTLLNGWVNFGSGFENAGYWKDSHNLVHVQGLVKLGTIPSTVFLLPVGYRPPAGLIFPVFSNNAFGWINVNTNGTVTASGGSNASFSLRIPPFRVILS